MRNFSDKSRRRKQNIFFSVTFFPTIALFMRQCGKIWYSHPDHRWQYDKAHEHCMLDT